MITAKNLLETKETYDYPTVSLTDAEEAMLEFARLHVSIALQFASITATLVEPVINTYYINRESILNAYPLENIK